jgi:hypothetical protein
MAHLNCAAPWCPFHKPDGSLSSKLGARSAEIKCCTACPHKLELLMPSHLMAQNRNSKGLARAGLLRFGTA